MDRLSHDTTDSHLFHSPVNRSLASRLGARLLAATLLLGACSASGSSDAATTADAASQTTDPTLETTDANSGGASSETVSSTLFDSTSVHSISVEFDDADYQNALDSYAATGDKDWIEATITIDGQTFEQAGIRLKGNSSLRGTVDTTGTTETGTAEGGGAQAPGGGNAGDATSEDPETMPWLIRLDKYVDGQNFDGVSDLVVRSNTSESSLNEAVALELLDLAGLASQDAISVRFSVNGSDEDLRLIIELPDDEWMDDNFDSSGALYKAKSSGDYSYRGDDAESYDDIFDQKAGDDNADLTPLIDFLEFINDSSDEEFAANLDQWLDVDSFATYLAMQDIINNFDDIDGPGNNSYLYYDTELELFTVVAWDHNLAFGSGPGGGGGGFGGAGGFAAGERPEGFERPGQGFPADGELPEGFAGAGGGGLGGSNTLVERFLASDALAEVKAQKVAALTEELVTSGVAADVVAAWSDMLTEHASDLISAEVVESEAAQILADLGS